MLQGGRRGFNPLDPFALKIFSQEHLPLAGLLLPSTQSSFREPGRIRHATRPMSKRVEFALCGLPPYL
jgi:hypothetical protein